MNSAQRRRARRDKTTTHQITRQEPTVQMPAIDPLHADHDQPDNWLPRAVLAVLVTLAATYTVSLLLDIAAIARSAP